MRHLLLLTIVSFSLSCSVIMYAPKTSKNEKGYWSKRIQKGIYKVYANFDSSSSPKRATGYIVIRGYELCQKEGRDYFSIGVVTEHKEFDHKTLSANIYCRKGASKYGLGAYLIGNTTRVSKVAKANKNKLKAEDVILSMNKKRVTTRNEVDNFLYNLRSSRKNMSVVVDRKGKKTILKFRPLIRKDVLSKADVLTVANKWKVPLTSIKGLQP